jgi:DNA (cytosine-5)-methyltransferase 1
MGNNTMVTMKTSQNLSVVSLFTGAGGLDIGFDQTGEFDLLACVELERAFCDTLVANRDAGHLGTPSTQVIQADVSRLDPNDLMEILGLKPGELDVLIGGPPCQSWSTAGRRGTVTDPRGQLIWDFLRFVEVLKPKYFVMENVRGLLSGALKHRPIAERPGTGGVALHPDEMPGSAIDLWIDDATAMDHGAYRVDLFEVNAVNYGAPQLRERVLFFGNRLGHSVAFPEPQFGAPGGNLPQYRTLRDAIGGFSESNPIIMDFSPRKKKYLSMVPPGGNWRALPDSVAAESMGKAFFAKGGRSGWWRRLSWDHPCPTITTMPNHASTSLCHPGEVRALSVAECARIQEFPQDWTFKGTPQEQMKQVGNAVPTRLGRIAAEVVAANLGRDKISGESVLPAFTRTYVNSHVRTRSWWRDGQSVIHGEVDPIAV